MSDIIETRHARTYPLPQGVMATVNWALSRQRVYSVAVDRAALTVASLLAGGGSVTAELVAMLAMISPDSESDCVRDDDDEVLTASGGACAPAAVRWNLYGGDNMHDWSRKILSNVQRETAGMITASLDQLDYDPDTYEYLGVRDSDTNDVVRALLRVASADPMNWALWEPEEGVWKSVPQANYATYRLDRDLVGVTASVLAQSEGLRLRFGNPSARLVGALPIIAAGELLEKLPPGARAYALVDRVDHTAVMELITIAPGPEVRTRGDGKWNVDPKVLSQLTSIDPPPLVELDDPTLDMVMAQIDGTVNQAENDPDYVESLGNEAAINQERAQTEEPLAAALETIRTKAEQERDAIDAEIDETMSDEARRREEFASRIQAVQASGDPTTAIVTRVDERTQRDGMSERLSALETRRELCDVRTRYESLRASLEALSDLKLQLAAFETVANSVPVTASSGSCWSNDDNLRKYWIKDCGSLKIKWVEEA